MPPGSRLLAFLLAAMGALIAGCAGGGANPTAVWQEPTLPPAATATAILPTDTPAPTATSAPTPARPTYTPRPAPTRLGDGERTPAPSFQALTLDGSAVYLEDTLGTPTLLAFWAPW